MASSSSTSARSTAAGSSSSASPPPALPTYSWEKAFERDTRVPQMHQFMEQILRANFPVVAQKLRKEEPPARRYEPTAPSQQRQVDGRPQTSVERASPVSQAALAPSKPPVPVTPLHPSAFQLHGYTSESSSEVDMREVDPMDELSDFETQLPPPLANSGGENRKAVQLRDADDGDDDEMNGGGVNDFDIEGDNADDDDDDEEETACVVCNSSANERQILLCDKCDGEYHLYCLTPPLTQVPLDEWFCPQCAPPQPQQAPAPIAPTPAHTPQVLPKRERAHGAVPPPPTAFPQASPVAATATVSVANTSQSQYAAASSGATAASSAPTPAPSQVQNGSRGQQPTQSAGQSNGSSSVAPPLQQQHPVPPPLSVAHTFESDAEKSNQLLVHACQCDELKCASPVFHEFCPHMKRFLRSACWASHSDKWRGYRIARVTAELFAYHAMHCHEPQCSVPMCDQLRAEEFV